MKIPSELLPEGWTQRMGDPVCPHGHRIEMDGKCPEGCVSPLRDAGII